MLFCKLTHPPPLCTSTKPFAFKMLFAEALLIPDAQQVMIGLSLLILDKLLFKLSSGILIEPLICPLWYSPFVRTSTMVAPFRRSSL